MTSLPHFEGQDPFRPGDVQGPVEGDAVDDPHRDARGPQEGGAEVGVVLAVALARFQGVKGVVALRRRYVRYVVHYPGHNPLHGIELTLDALGQFPGQVTYAGIAGLNLSRGQQIIGVFHPSCTGHGERGACGDRREVCPAGGRAGEGHIQGPRGAGPGGRQDEVAPLIPNGGLLLWLGSKSELEILHFLSIGG